jgi:hypothetical protein
MQQRRPNWVWVARIVAVLVLAGLATYLSLVGLDKADKLASVLGLLVAVATLVAPYLVSSADRNDSASGPRQRIARAVVGGHVTQVRRADSVRVNGPHAPRLPQVTPSETSSPPEDDGSHESAQQINGIWAGGNVTQVDDADGDVTIG